MDSTDTLTVIVVSVIVVVFVALSIRIVPPGERLVVYRLGKASAVSIRGYAGRSARYLVFIIPVVDRVLRIRGDLVEEWDALRDTLPEGWVLRRPVEDSTRAAWRVQAQGPGGDEVEGTGGTQREALDELTRQLAELSSITAG
jgi:regulator of protease activity HflC (stomatin/prohibitin superfamily)